MRKQEVIARLKKAVDEVFSKYEKDAIRETITKIEESDCVTLITDNVNGRVFVVCGRLEFKKTQVAVVQLNGSTNTNFSRSYIHSKRFTMESIVLEDETEEPANNVEEKRAVVALIKAYVDSHKDIIMHNQYFKDFYDPVSDTVLALVIPDRDTFEDLKGFVYKEIQKDYPIIAAARLFNDVEFKRVSQGYIVVMFNSIHLTRDGEVEDDTNMPIIPSDDRKVQHAKENVMQLVTPERAAREQRLVKALEDYRKAFGDSFPLMEFNGDMDEAIEQMYKCIKACHPLIVLDTGEDEEILQLSCQHIENDIQIQQGKEV